MPFFYIDQYYLLLVIPALIISMIAQARVKSTYSKYSKVLSRRGLTGAQAARMILDANGLQHVQITLIAGELSDHYDPRTNTIGLSRGVAQSSSVAAVGVAAHEVGHAIQYAQEYLPIKIRSAIIPVTQIGSSLAPILILAGLLFSAPMLVSIGVLAFGLMVVFQLVTLPVEYNASNRAMDTLDSMQVLERDELTGTKKVLGAAAMTYVAAMLVSLANFLRLFLLFGRRDNRN